MWCIIYSILLRFIFRFCDVWRYIEKFIVFLIRLFRMKIHFGFGFYGVVDWIYESMKMEFLKQDICVWWWGTWDWNLRNLKFIFNLWLSFISNTDFKKFQQKKSSHSVEIPSLLPYSSCVKNLSFTQYTKNNIQKR